MQLPINPSIQLACAILLPTALLLIGIPLIFLICRHRHQRRMRELEARERFLTADEDLLRAEHVGESTLQVCLKYIAGMSEVHCRLSEVHCRYLCVFVYLFLYSAQYLHILQDSERYLTHPTAQVQSQLTSNSHSPN